MKSTKIKRLISYSKPHELHKRNHMLKSHVKCQTHDASSVALKLWLYKATLEEKLAITCL